MSFGKNLRKIRESKGLTQEDVANHFDIHFTHVSKWERDEVRPRPKTQSELASFLGVSEAMLIDNSPPPNNVLTLAQPIPPGLKDEYEAAVSKFNELAINDPQFLARVFRVLQSGLLDTESGVQALESLVSALRPEQQNLAGPDDDAEKLG